MEVTHIFFDLDHTLWDFEKNSALTFQKILPEADVDLVHEQFINTYIPINAKYWKLYREEKVSKAALRYARLKETFHALKYEISDEKINSLAKEYILQLPNFPIIKIDSQDDFHINGVLLYSFRNYLN